MKVIKKQQLLLLISTAIMALMISCTTAFLPAAPRGVLSTPYTSLTVLQQERERSSSSSVYQQREGGRGDGRGYQGRGGRGRGTCICIYYMSFC